MKNLMLLYFVTYCAAIFAQVQADTSYTVAGTFKKEIRNYPFIKIAERPHNTSVSHIKNVVYKSISSHKLHFDAYYKKEGPIQPAVILIHGGGWKSGNKEQMHLLAQELAQKGYACFAVEFRLSAEAKYPAAVLDAKAAIKFVKENAIKFNADPNRFAVLGCSSGGQMAALIGTTNGNVSLDDKVGRELNQGVQAIIDMDGILAFHHPESKEGKAAALWLGGTYEEKPEVWKEASALSHCGKNTPPILFINSSNPRFHAGQDDMIAILNKYNIYNEVKAIPNSPHSFWFFDPWFDDIVNYSTQFLDKVLKQK